MTDPVDALGALLRSRSQKEWELLIVADWPTYSVSGWPTGRHAPFAPALPPEDWCRGVRSAREAVIAELRKSRREPALAAAEERAKQLSTDVALSAATRWTDIEGLPMHVQAAKSVLWIAALYPELTTGQFTRLWEPYASVANYLADFAREHLPPRPEDPARERPNAGLLGKLFGRG